MSIPPYLLAAIAAASRTVAGGGGVTVQQAGHVGANIDGHEEYSDARVFVDMVMTTRGFATLASPYSGVGAVLGATGWPAGDFSFVVGNFPDNKLTAGTGVYEASYRHTSQLTINGGQCTVSNHRSVGGGVYRFQVTLSGAQAPTLAFSGVTSAFSDIRVIRPGYSWDTAAVFTDEWLQRVSRYSTLRMMDFMLTSGTVSARPYFSNGGQTTWAERWTDTHPESGKVWRRHTLEMVAQIANATGKDIWVCIPHRATDDYIAGMFNLLNTQVNPGIKIYVEYSNEIWNTKPSWAAQYLYCQQQAKVDLGLLGGLSFATELSSASIASGVVTVDFLVPHGRTVGQDVLVRMGSTGSFVPAGRYTVAAVASPTSLSFALPAGVNGSIAINNGCFIATNPDSDLAFDWTAGMDASGQVWPSMQSEYYWGYRFAAKRTARAKDILVGINPALVGNRFRFVACHQWGAIAVFSQCFLKYFQRHHAPMAGWLYGIGGAPYTGTDTGATSVDATIAATQVKLLERRYSYQQWVTTAKALGIKVCLYETGVDLNGAINGVGAGTDPRMRQIVYDVMMDPIRYGVELANFYTETAGDLGSGFPLRTRFESTDADCPKLGGMSDALAAVKPDLSPDLKALVQPVDYTTPDYTRSGYAMNAPEMYLSYSVPSAKNILIAGGSLPAGFRPKLAFAMYVETAGAYDLVWQIGANSAGVAFDLYVDDVLQASTITANFFASVDATACTDTAPVRVSLTAGWHVFRVRSVNASAARVGARQFKLLPV